jgi:hypothetical protein
MDDQFRKEYEEGQRRAKEEEAAVHREKMRGKKATVATDKLDVD